MGNAGGLVVCWFLHHREASLARTDTQHLWLMEPAGFQEIRSKYSPIVTCPLPFLTPSLSKIPGEWSLSSWPGQTGKLLVVQMSGHEQAEIKIVQ